MAKKTFILGVGAQKSGTTWLYKYLGNCHMVDMGPQKEYHCWDAAYFNLESDIRPEMQKKRAFYNAKSALSRLFGHPDPGRLRDHLRDNHEHYFNFFEKRLARNKTLLTGDITPSYAALTPAQFDLIKSGFAKRNINVRVIFLMRDPVDRVWSAIRMIQRRGFSARVKILENEESSLREYYHTAHAKRRGDYKNTITNLEKVFSPAEIHFGFYENMFEPGEIERISKFLGLPAQQRFARRKVNSGGAKRDLNPELAQEIRESYSDIYDFCAGRFPETKALWQHA